MDGVFVAGWFYKDQLNPIGELDAAGGIRSLFLYDDGAHVPYAMVKDDVLYRIVTDHLGSLRLVVRANDGEIVQKMDYSAYGEVKEDTNPGFQPFGFAGGLYDEDTGLVRFGARDYDPQTGRWTAKDPIGFQGGQANLYVYVGGDPVNFVDPWGLCYYDFNFSIPGITFGLQISPESGLHLYGGINVGGFGYGATKSPNNPTPGLNWGFTYGLGAGGQVGGKLGSGPDFAEWGTVWGGASASVYYVSDGIDLTPDNWKTGDGY